MLQLVLLFRETTGVLGGFRRRLPLHYPTAGIIGVFGQANWPVVTDFLSGSLEEVLAAKDDFWSLQTATQKHLSGSAECATGCFQKNEGKCKFAFQLATESDIY